MSSGELRKYEYLTGEDLGYKPSVLERTKFDYSPLGEVFNKGLDDKDDQKERLLKRLKNMEKNQSSNNNDKSKPSSARSESSKKTLISDDKLERSIHFLDVANMKGINNLELKMKYELLLNI